MIKEIKDVNELVYPTGKKRFNPFDSIFIVVIRGGQEHDRDQLSLMVLKRIDIKLGKVWRWESIGGAHGHGAEAETWEELIQIGIDSYGGVVFHCSDQTDDLMIMLQYCQQNNIKLMVDQVKGYNYGRTPIQEKCTCQK